MHKTYNLLVVVILIIFIHVAVILLMSHHINQLDFINGVCIIKDPFGFGRKENRKIWDQYDRYITIQHKSYYYLSRYIITYIFCNI